MGEGEERDLMWLEVIGAGRQGLWYLFNALALTFGRILVLLRTTILSMLIGLSSIAAKYHHQLMIIEAASPRESSDRTN